jgi:hypothetical protein
MTKLNQIIAIEKGVKTNAYRELTDLHKGLKKGSALQGIQKTYRPKEEEGETLPPEAVLVQTKVREQLRTIAEIMTRYFDITATKDSANTQAKSDVMLDGKAFLTGVPAPYLLFLEKQLKDLHDVVRELPLLDPAETWAYDPNTGVYRTPVTTTHRTKKLPRVLVKYEATEEHPAQTEVYQEDITVGYWDKVAFSGAIPADLQKQLLERIRILQQAVKFAREEANNMKVEDVKVGEQVFKYLFDGV